MSKHRKPYATQTRARALFEWVFTYRIAVITGLYVALAIYIAGYLVGGGGVK